MLLVMYYILLSGKIKKGDIYGYITRHFLLSYGTGLISGRSKRSY